MLQRTDDVRTARLSPGAWCQRQDPRIQCRPRLRTDDAVRLQPVGNLKGDHGLPRPGPIEAVDPMRRKASRLETTLDRSHDRRAAGAVIPGAQHQRSPAKSGVGVAR